MKNNKAINDFCKRHNLTVEQFEGKEKISGSLYLRGLTSIPEGFNPTVGGYLDLMGILSAPTKPYIEKPFVWQEGKYIMIDGLFTEVVRKRGNVYVAKKINATKEFYIVTNGDGQWSHGDTLKEAKEDLIYKLSSRDTTEYKSMKMTDKMTFGQAVACYRKITGSCAFGVKSFVDRKGISRKKKYSIAEILKLTSGEYGHSDFAKFFN